MDHKTEKYCYQSKYGGGWITAPNYLVELIMEKLAKKEGRTLPKRFWAAAPYDKVYRKQIKDANHLLEEYSVWAIESALNDDRTRNIYSLGAKFILLPIIKEYEKKKPRAVSGGSRTVESPRPVFSNKKSIIGKLDG